MKVRQFYVDGFRSLKETSVTGLATKCIFHGDNGSGKSNLLLALEVIFQSKESGPGLALKHEEPGEAQPRRSTPFWQGEIPDFGDNFYMGGHGPITFDVLLQVASSFLPALDDEGILASLEKSGHDFLVQLEGQITRQENAGVMALSKVDINKKPAMRQRKGGTEWLPDYDAPTDTRQRVVESVLDALTDQVRVVPASRFLSEETISTTEAPLRPRSYKNWLHKMSLSRDGYETFRRVTQWFASKPFELGEISFVAENDRLELMVEDECDYRMSVDQKGSGIQQTLVLLGYIAESNAAIVAVEEPELNLSFRNQDLIVNILRTLVENTGESPHQILLTSHSDHIGSREDLKQYHVEKANGTDTVVRQFSSEDRLDLFPRSNRIAGRRIQVGQRVPDRRKPSTLQAE